MDVKLLTAIIAACTALVTTIVVQYITGRRIRSSVKEHYRKIFFERQLNGYEALWQKLRPISRYFGPLTVLNRKAVDGEMKWVLNTSVSQKFCDELTDLFFSNHGVFLSKTTRKVIFEIRDEISSTLQDIPEGVEEFELEDNARKRISGLTEGAIGTIREDIGLLNLSFEIEDLGLK